MLVLPAELSGVSKHIVNALGDGVDLGLVVRLKHLGNLLAVLLVHVVLVLADIGEPAKLCLHLCDVGQHRAAAFRRGLQVVADRDREKELQIAPIERSRSAEAVLCQDESEFLDMTGLRLETNLPSPGQPLLERHQVGRVLVHDRAPGGVANPAVVEVVLGFHFLLDASLALGAGIDDGAGQRRSTLAVEHHQLPVGWLPLVFGPLPPLGGCKLLFDQALHLVDQLALARPSVLQQRGEVVARTVILRHAGSHTMDRV
mmetsp:Transcript_9402/g.24234  ORF Transcript_9402/g.24234 Transcript_9402/m.24234 type:complete len:258 (-) Transcript_9402:3569-4342(-)